MFCQVFRNQTDSLRDCAQIKRGFLQYKDNVKAKIGELNTAKLNKTQSCICTPWVNVYTADS